MWRDAPSGTTMLHDVLPSAKSALPPSAANEARATPTASAKNAVFIVFVFPFMLFSFRFVLRYSGSRQTRRQPCAATDELFALSMLRVGNAHQGGVWLQRPPFMTR